jgi:hypothetical protein
MRKTTWTWCCRAASELAVVLIVGGYREPRQAELEQNLVKECHVSFLLYGVTEEAISCPWDRLSFQMSGMAHSTVLQSVSFKQAQGELAVRCSATVLQGELAVRCGATVLHPQHVLITLYTYIC